jgi:PAS domain S-box-containing protein
MRDNLLKVARETKERGWAMSGISNFSDMLRDNHEDLQKMYDTLLMELIKYVNANQGGIFIISDQRTEEEEFMIAESCYAWDRFKGLDKKIYRGEGLAGQAWLEKSTIFVTDFPNHYVEITSGLGKNNPTSILIVPVQFNDKIFGIIELASFHAFKPFEIEFVEHVAESFASTLSSVKVNISTQKLLGESQLLTEQLRMQEEETRMNMEELQAIQEEMRRKQSELTEVKTNLEHEVERQTQILRDQGEEMRKQNIQLMAQQAQMQSAQQSLQSSERKLREILNSAPDAIITTNEKGVIEMVNEVALEFTRYKLSKLKGNYIDRIFPSLANENLSGQGKITSKIHRRDGSKEEVELVYSRVKYEGEIHTLFFIRDVVFEESE